MHRLVQAAGRALVEADISAWVMCAVQLVHAGLLDRDDAIKAINTDLDNIRYILRWAIENKKDVSGGASILNRLSTFWQATEKYAEAHRWYESVLALSDLVPKDLYTRLLLDAGAIEIFRDNFDRSIELLETAIPMLRSPDQILVRARALSTLATALYSRGFYERAEPLWRESLEILENADHEAGMARVIGNLGLIEWQIRGNYDLARELYERGLKLSSRSESAVARSPLSWEFGRNLFCDR